MGGAEWRENGIVRGKYPKQILVLNKQSGETKEKARQYSRAYRIRHGFNLTPVSSRNQLVGIERGTKVNVKVVDIVDARDGADSVRGDGGIGNIAESKGCDAV